MRPANGNAPAAGNSRGVGSALAGNFGSNGSPLERFKQALPGRVRPNGPGWRADCPGPCDDHKQALSFREADDGKLLLYCFKGCNAADVLAAVGMRLCDVYPFRAWPESPEEKRRARKAIREIGWAAALETVTFEASIALIATRQLCEQWQPLSDEEEARLSVAVDRLYRARGVLNGH